MAAVAAARGTTPAELERALYADLPEAHRLTAFDPLGPDALLALYDTAQVQAVLLRAVRVGATVRSGAPAVYRHLFRRLKFLRLLFRIERRDRGFRLEIDGPFSLFEAVTRYGLQLALAFPAIAACDEWALEADLRWGREQRPLRLLLRGQAAGAAQEAPPLPDEVAALLGELEALGGPWRARVCGAVLELPGVGVCVPDLELAHAETGRVVYLEVLGYWSREAVWRRVELVEKGLGQPVVFAVSRRLRVSEEALPEELPARLYVYGRVMNARAVLARVEAVAAQL